MFPLAASVGILVFVGLMTVALLPSIIAWRRKHNNLVVVVVFNLFIVFVPVEVTLAYFCWVGCLLVALWKTTDRSGPQGPRGFPGQKGDRGEDAVPISKVGVLCSGEDK